MITIPSRAAVGRIMPKEAFYNRLTLSTEVREKFISDVKRIVMEYKIAPDTINVEKGKEITEILVLSLDLKKQDIDYRIVENIARQNMHKLIFLLKFNSQGQLAIYYNKLYKTSWMPLEKLNLDINGLNIDSIWDGLIEQIAIQEFAPYDSLSIDEKLKKQDIILKIEKEIYKLERLSRNEKQPKKRFELYTRLQNLKNKLAQEKGE
ncbi:hypothetical protein COJ85_11660 [Bacillus sp. AFS076308]|uniref:DUF4391 domain-containing protein n=1 Tax=Bacillus sp. AFS076308 TaxID=2033512 RepID=UPI000BF9D809|nr:DUF4391 domain-containing protein [Bacillus sp. AFS076308]PFO04681.1 hypothetical protein COJ85_11660 [Bacillus sp. AFS076308]